MCWLSHRASLFSVYPSHLLSWSRVSKSGDFLQLLWRVYFLSFGCKGWKREGERRRGFSIPPAVFSSIFHLSPQWLLEPLLPRFPGPFPVLRLLLVGLHQNNGFSFGFLCFAKSVTLYICFPSSQILLIYLICWPIPSLFFGPSPSLKKFPYCHFSVVLGGTRLTHVQSTDLGF